MLNLLLKKTHALAIVFTTLLTYGVLAQVAVAHVSARLTSNYSQWNGKDPLSLGLEFVMQEGWHIYWQNPGESGMPVRVNWEKPNWVDIGNLSWPKPIRFKTGPITSFGYESQTVLQAPLTLTVGATSSTQTPLNIKAKIQWLECKDVCIPNRAEVSLNLPVVPHAPSIESSDADLLSRWKNQIPLSLASLGLKFQETDHSFEWVMSNPWPKSERVALDFFPTSKRLTDMDQIPVVKALPDGNLSIFLKKHKNFDPSLTYFQGVLSHSQSKFPAFEISHPRDVPPPPKTFGGMFLLAFLGGLILNLMPCVFPVIGLKILSFVHKSQQKPAAVRVHGLVFTLGVVLSFWILALALEVLRLGGAELGWGFQIQQPWFVMALTFLFLAMGLSLLGWFDFGHSLMQWSMRFQSKNETINSFLTGALAVVVATPCTGPFMASAVGYALTQSPLTSLGIFTGIALGMSSPYLILSIFPQALKLMPKPGPWMEWLKKSLAIPLFLTVIWLLWVLSLQTSATVWWISLTSLLIFGALIGFRKRFSIRIAALVLIPILGQFLLGQGPAPLSSPGAHTIEKFNLQWEPFNAERLEVYRDQGKPVFIDFTAAWCVTCQMNEQITFGNKEVQSRLKNSDIILMIADWTNQDDAITQELRKHGRSGVPVYVLYGRETKSPPLLLPEILTPGIFLEAIEKI